MKEFYVDEWEQGGFKRQTTPTTTVRTDQQILQACEFMSPKNIKPCNFVLFCGQMQGESDHVLEIWKVSDV